MPLASISAITGSVSEPFTPIDRDPQLPKSTAPHVEAMIGLSNLAKPIGISSSDIISKLPPVESGTLAYSGYLADQLEETIR
jgi:hypothetical protein